MWKWVTTMSRTSLDGAPGEAEHVLERLPRARVAAPPVSTSTMPPSAWSIAKALTCDMCSQGVGSRSCHSPGTTSKARARGRVDRPASAGAGRPLRGDFVVQAELLHRAPRSTPFWIFDADIGHSVTKRT